MSQGHIEAEVKCLKCNKPLDAFTSVEEDAKPVDGDISICFYCGNIGTYENNLTKLKQFTDEDMEKLKDEEPDSYNMILKAVKHIKQMKNN